MKRTVTVIILAALFALLLCTTGALADYPGLAIDEDNFPNDEIREAMRVTWDHNRDGYISSEEAMKVTYLSFCGSGTADLTGLSRFENLESLYIDGTALKKVKLPKLRTLTRLVIKNSPVASLSISGCVNLQALVCDNTALKSLSLKKNDRLVTLECTGNRKLKLLDISKNADLTEAVCDDNALLRLTTGKQTKLAKLSCRNNRLRSLDVSGLSRLQYLDCSNNRLTALKLPAKKGALKNLNCEGNALKKLSVFGYRKLENLKAGNNRLTQVIFLSNRNLTYLYLEDNPALLNLNVAGCARIASVITPGCMDYLVSYSSESSFNRWSQGDGKTSNTAFCQLPKATTVVRGKEVLYRGQNW